jgi:hypothetical protein
MTSFRHRSRPRMPTYGRTPSAAEPDVLTRPWVRFEARRPVPTRLRGARPARRTSYPQPVTPQVGPREEDSEYEPRDGPVEGQRRRGGLRMHHDGRRGGLHEVGQDAHRPPKRPGPRELVVVGVELGPVQGVAAAVERLGEEEDQRAAKAQ